MSRFTSTCPSRVGWQQTSGTSGSYSRVTVTPAARTRWATSVSA